MAETLYEENNIAWMIDWANYPPPTEKDTLNKIFNAAHSLTFCILTFKKFVKILLVILKII